MTITLHVILLLLAFVFFVLAAINIPTPRNINLTAAGLALWVLAQLAG